MEDIGALYRVDLEKDEFELLSPCEASKLAVKEKRIEEWMAVKPELLFSDKDAVMVIAQELSGEPQADLLAVDSQGNLIIIEIKRHWSDRSTVGQILDYAARLFEWDYEAFNQRWKADKGKEKGDLFEEFKTFVENPEFKEEEFLRERRLYILASEADESLKRVVTWLRTKYKVPIEHVSFTFFRQKDEVFLQIQKIDVEPIVYRGKWAGDWLVNTNEENHEGAYKKMLKQSVIAACGFGLHETKRKMDLPSKRERVFAYLNGYGIIAVGQVEDNKTEQETSVFGRKDKDEFHRKVSWTAIVDLSNAVATRESSQWGYNLPVRGTISRMYNAKVAELIAQELEKRASKKK